MLSFLSNSFSNLSSAIANTVAYLSPSKAPTVLIDMANYLNLKVNQNKDPVYTNHFVNLLNYLKHSKNIDLNKIDIKEQSEFQLPAIDESLADNTYVKSFVFLAENLDEVKNYVEECFKHLKDNQDNKEYTPCYKDLLDDLTFHYNRKYLSQQHSLSTSSTVNNSLSSLSPISSLAVAHFPSITDNPNAPTLLDGLMILARARRICENSPLSLPLNEFEEELRQITVSFLQAEFTELEKEVINKRRSLPTPPVFEQQLDLSASLMGSLSAQELNFLKNSQPAVNPLQQSVSLQLNTDLPFGTLYSNNIEHAKQIAGSTLEQDFNNPQNMLESINLGVMVSTSELRWQALDKKYLSTKINTQHFITIKSNIMASEIGKKISPCYISLANGLYTMSENAINHQFTPSEVINFSRLLITYARKSKQYLEYSDAISALSFFADIKPFFTFTAEEFIQLAMNEKSLISIYKEKLDSQLFKTEFDKLSKFLPYSDTIQALAVKVSSDSSTLPEDKEKLSLYQSRLYHHAQRSARLELGLKEVLGHFKKREEESLLTTHERTELTELKFLIIEINKKNPGTNLIQSAHMFMKEIDTLQNQLSKSSSNENIFFWMDEQSSLHHPLKKNNANFFAFTNIKNALNDIIVSKHEKTPSYEPLVSNLLIILEQFKNKSSNNQNEFFPSQVVELIAKMFNYYEEKYSSMFDKKWSEPSNLRQTM